MSHSHYQDSSPRGRRMIICSHVLPFVLIAATALAPFSARAWFFSVAQAQTDSTNAIVSSDADSNAQTVTLLSTNVPLASGDNSAIDPDADVTIDSGSALAPEIGIDGTLADVTGESDADSGAIQTYSVVSGDTVAKVAAKFKISESDLRLENQLSPIDVLHVGDLLLILPSSSSQSSGSSESSKPLKSKTSSSSSSPAKASHFVFRGNTDDMGSTALMIKVPVVSTIVRNYFIKPIPCPMTQGRHDLYAVDLSCGVVGTPIKAAADGIIMYAKYGDNGGYGNLIIMKHPNGMLTFYAHIKDDGFAVKQGQSVTQGTVIAYVGDTGNSTGPHLHFEVRGGGNPGFDYSGAAWKKS